MQDYIIGPDGSVFSRKVNRYLKCQQINSGYLRYQINGHSKFAHRLVAQTYLPNPNNHKYVNHKNGIKTDNRVENLEWCDHVTNMRHAREVLGIKHSAKLTRTQVDEIKALKGTMTLKEVGKLYGVAPSTIGMIHNGTNWAQ